MRCPPRPRRADQGFQFGGREFDQIVVGLWAGQLGLSNGRLSTEGGLTSTRTAASTECHRLLGVCSWDRK